MTKRTANERTRQAAQDAARFENTGDLVIVVGHGVDSILDDGDPRIILYLSSRWERVFHRPVDDLVGRPFSVFLNDSHARIVPGEKVGELVNPRSRSTLENSILLRYSDLELGARLLEGNAYRVLDDPTDCVVVFRDATAKWNAQEIVQSQRLESLGRLAGGVAHNFNNHLTPIVGNIGLALLDLPATSPVRKRIEMIRAAADRATALTRQLLAFAGQAESHVNAVSVTVAIEEMSLLLESTTSGSVLIEYELKRDLPFIEVDSQHIGQVVLNLVTNACESFPETGGRIVINTGLIEADRAYLDACLIGDDLEKGKYVYLEVCDDGPGIPDEERVQVFEPHFTTRKSARGLGLTAVDRIVRHYRGAVELMTAVGEGTRIRVLLPTTPPRSRP